MTTSDKDKLEDTYVSLSQQGASLIHHVSTPIAIARVNIDFLNRYLDVLLEHYQQTSSDSGTPRISGEHLLAIKRAPELISEQLDSIQAQVKAHWQSMNREVTGKIPDFQISQRSNTKVLNKILDQAQSANILLVEDEAIHRDIAVKVLAGNFAIDTVESGEEALANCQHKQYDLILMDLYLPGISGQEAARKIRHSMNADAIIIGLTNMPLGQQEDDDCLNAYLSKPLDLNALTSCLVKIQKLSTT